MGLTLRTEEEGTSNLISICAGITGRGAGMATSVTGRTIVLSWCRVSRNHALEKSTHAYNHEIVRACKHTCKAS